MKTTKRPVVMVFCDYYLPGYKSGGGMRTIVNMVDRLSDRYDFRIVTRDHDGKLDRRPYDSVKIGEWNRLNGSDVYFLSKKEIRMSVLRRLINEIQPDAIYTNSVFSTLAIYVLKLRKLGLIKYFQIVVAPCGELATGALGIKNTKKRAFLNYAKLIRLYKDVIWKASTEVEANEVRSFKPKDAEIFVAPDLAPLMIYRTYKQEGKPYKAKGEVRFVFLSRFVKNKNFNWILPVLEKIEGRVVLDVVGPIEDKEYWCKAERLIATLPSGITVKSCGPIAHEHISETLFNYHFLLSPTLGENFGHIYLEALASGCPLVISDLTPWRELEKAGTGWDLSLDEPGKWIEVINRCVAMDNEEFSRLSSNARDFVTGWLSAPGLADSTEAVLQRSLER